MTVTDRVSRDLLLVARDWRARALTLAELREAGYQVTAVPGVRYALELLDRGRIKPPIVVLDVHDDPDATPESAARLIDSARAPVVLVIGAFGRVAWESLRSRVSALLQRPVSIGDVVEAVRATVPPRASDDAEGIAGTERT